MTINFDRTALRIAAAEDVLTRIIPDEDLILTTSCYLDVDHDTREPCRACAAGALTLAVIAPHVLGNLPWGGGQTLAQEMQGYFDKDQRLESEDIREALLALFDLEQLALIEAAFMQNFCGEFANPKFLCSDGEKRYANTINGYNLEELLDPLHRAFLEQLKAGVRFGDEYDDPNERLAAIMQNIVKNGGTFVPED